ncbi:uncharacterized [Tachysurus ichikawai]
MRATARGQSGQGGVEILLSNALVSRIRLHHDTILRSTLLVPVNRVGIFTCLQFSAPLRSPFPLSGWTRAVHAGTCSPCSSLLGAGSASVCAFEYYNSHTGGPSISPFLPPDQSL